MLGDPRTTTGSLISATTDDGIRYTARYRNRLLDDSLRWVLTNFDPIFISQNGMPIGSSQLRLLANDVLQFTSTSGYTSYYATNSRIMRLLSITATNPNTSELINVPIISPTSRRLRFLSNSHWQDIPFAYVCDRDGTTGGIGIIGQPTTVSYTFDAIYIREWTEVGNPTVTNNVLSITDTDIGFGKQMHTYIIMHATYVNKLNSQRLQEGALVKQAVDAEAKGLIQTIEQTKQVAYNK